MSRTEGDYEAGKRAGLLLAASAVETCSTIWRGPAAPRGASIPDVLDHLTRSIVKLAASTGTEASPD